jgi:Ni/Fe-hydrogenase subunit HybB-like protein
VGVFADRLTFVEAGQMAPVTTVSGVVSAPYAAYSPSLVEIAIIVGGVGLIAFMYTLAERYLDLSESEVHVMIWLPPALVARVRAALPVITLPRLRRRPRVALGEQTEQLEPETRARPDIESEPPEEAESWPA